MMAPARTKLTCVSIRMTGGMAECEREAFEGIFCGDRQFHGRACYFIEPYEACVPGRRVDRGRRRLRARRRSAVDARAQPESHGNRPAAGESAPRVRVA